MASLAPPRAKQFPITHAQSAEFSPVTFDSNGGFAFMFGTMATLAAVCTAEKTFVNLNGTGQLGSIRKNRAGS
jgi:hypothetical protein